MKLFLLSFLFVVVPFCLFLAWAIRRDLKRRVARDTVMAEVEREASYVQRTTDEWSEEFAGQFQRDVDTHIEMMTDLRGIDAYGLRRMIMISLRQFCRDKGFEE